MARTISSYETIFVVDLQLGEEGVAAVIEKFKTLIAENGYMYLDDADIS